MTISVRGDSLARENPRQIAIPGVVMRQRGQGSPVERWRSQPRGEGVIVQRQAPRLAWIFAAVNPLVLLLGRRRPKAELPADVERGAVLTRQRASGVSSTIGISQLVRFW
jgi:hypothetical protein